MLLEICAANYESAINAEKAGAHRIELCSELAVGGLTPSFGFIKQVIETVSIPVFVLIRPRSGNFTYSNEEFEIMKMDIQSCKDLGCKGIVTGILNVDNTIDVERLRQLVILAKPLSFTFNRAFDWTPNPYEALEQLTELNIDRILTSGQETSAEKGIFVLQQLKKLADGRIKILPSSGINPDNVLIFKGGMFDEVHSSATLIKPLIFKGKVPMNSQKLLDETVQYCSSVEIIQSIINQINENT